MRMQSRPATILIAGLAFVALALLPGCGQGGGGAASSQLERARKLIDAGNYEQAFMELNQALALAPQDPQVHLNLGWLYLYTDDAEHANAELQKLAQLAPDMAETHHLRGALFSYYAQHEKDPAKVREHQEAAIRNFEEALGKDGNNYQTYFDLATSLAAVGKHEDVLGMLDKGFDHIPPNDLETQVNFQIASCSAHAQLGMYDEAVADCRQALEFTNSDSSRERITEMIENMKLLEPRDRSQNEAVKVDSEGAMREAEENAVIDAATSD